MSARRWSAVLSAVLLAGSVGQAAAAAPTSRPDVRVAESPIFFSPNGDGHRDRARVQFSLDTQANVSVLVRHGRDVVRGPERLGRLDGGRHAWTWDGRRGGGAKVKEGTFSIVVRATRDGRTDKAVVTAYVDRVADAGRVVTTRPTVYPKASVVSDRVGITYLREGWNAADSQQPSGGYPESRSPLTVDLTVVDATGRVVWQRPWMPQYAAPNGRALTFAFTWHARGPGGEPLPEGTYDARIRVADAAGNVATYTAPITVSHQQLRREVWTSTVSAASAARYVPPGCALCADRCGPVASDRFAGGLSFRACPDPDRGTVAWFSSAPPVRAAPYDTFRITASGGPTTPGADDVGSISGYQQVGPGDTSASSPWLYVDLDTSPYLPDQQGPVRWYFSTEDGDAFDVATFTVEYRYYVPEV